MEHHHKSSPYLGWHNKKSIRKATIIINGPERATFSERSLGKRRLSKQDRQFVVDLKKNCFPTAPKEPFLPGEVLEEM
jgi:hypothetical protein